ncbi:hypothetical protein ACRZ5O_20310 [Pseudomonas protegens]|uniref:hypothetical protein n=1 Tax=Pseudomonas protegens TaxID=380021 RepID=UPI0004423E28|nr:hypothetical protein [Pseudomonas protegens]BAO63070.1 hypothetical protein PPC_3723 [Pseudomonas protegens Cab57]
MFKSKGLWSLAALLLAQGAYAEQVANCQEQKVQGHSAQMCLLPGAAFQHDTYRLTVDDSLIFSLTDDFAEDVTLVHRIPAGPAVEYPLSRQGTRSVTLKGGCVPVSEGNLEVARLCNFHWGTVQVVKDVRFNF